MDVGGAALRAVRASLALAAAVLAAAGGCALVDASGEPDPPTACESAEAERGPVDATYDPTITEGGNCTYGPSDDTMVVGVSEFDYGGSTGCGGCLEVERAGVARVVVRVVDSCAACTQGELVLSEDAFLVLESNIDVGVVPVTWRWVECPVDGPIAVQFMEDANELWLAVQVRDHRHRIAQVEARVSGADSWRLLDRTDYNYFLADDGMGPGPLDFRVEDVYGHQVAASDMMVEGGALRAGDDQLPSCE